MKDININKSSLKNFLAVYDAKIDEKSGTFIPVVNIVIYGVAAVLYDNVVIWFLFGVFTIFILSIASYFFKRMERSKRNLFLYYGGFLISGALASSLSFYAFLRIYIRKEQYIMLVGLLICLGIFALANFYVYFRKLRTNYYQNKPSLSVPGIAFFAFVAMASRTFTKTMDGYLLGSIMCAFFSFVFMGGSVFSLVKSYAYSIVGEEKERDIIMKKSTKSYSFYTPKKKR